MKTPHKVTLEIFANKYTWRVLDKNGVTLAKRTMKSTSYGAGSDEKACVWDDAVAAWPELAEAIGDSSDYEVMRALEIEDDS